MPQDSNTLPLNIDPQTVSRFGAGGALAGGSAAAALALVHMLRRLNSQRQSNSEDTDSQPGTIVLTLPNKSAAGVDPGQGFVCCVPTFIITLGTISVTFTVFFIEIRQYLIPVSLAIMSVNLIWSLRQVDIGLMELYEQGKVLS